ncbi:class II fumarate hydratase [Prochlorococcus sp. MIT 1223]|uniref:class II fumarate hydratase n=1 Tax=Prochlorococcus sp. MIT 1223 TaxID=3096217 RepID=UPI002A750827|nr:class II fumarate hydratase [Prochlorococcus sp. MIT 1223]
MDKKVRVEYDSLGGIEVPTSALWGAQTQRSLGNFSIGTDLMPIKVIYALATIKNAAAIVNNKFGLIDDKKKNLILLATQEILNGVHDRQFPLKVWQTGSGTQTNMNINEVIANIASHSQSMPLGSHQPLHPNDHVNRSQSTNDVFPASIQISTAKEINSRLLPELSLLIGAFTQKSNEWRNIIKIGRTHLQDAVPLTLGQEVSAWRDQLLTGSERIKESLKELYHLPLGGTAVGTGLNAPSGFDYEIAKEISVITGLPFITAKNKFALMASHDGLVNLMTNLKMLAISLLKIVNDIRLLSSGPRAGIAELELPANEPGSSIMPGKINPTQCEAMAMVCTQVIALDVAVGMAGSGGHLQMNAYKPQIAFNILKSIELLHDACLSCRVSMIEGIKPNEKKIKHDLDQSLMLVTALTPTIGYEKACNIAQLAHNENISLRQAVSKLGYLTEADFDKLVDPISMTSFD